MPTRRTTTAGAKTNYRYFVNAIRDNQISQRQLAGKMGMDPSALNLALRGKRRLQLDEAARLSKLLSLPLDDVLYNAGVELPPEQGKGKGVSVPVTGYVDAEFRVHAGATPGPRKVEAPPVPLRGLEALRIRTAASSADAWDGAILYFRPMEDVEAESIGRMCIVLTAAGDRLVRVLRQGYVRGTYNLAHLNGGLVDEAVKVVSASPVVWMRL